MNLLVSTLALVLYTISAQYQASYFRDNLRVASFAFSENEEFMIVNQGFYMKQIRLQSHLIVTLPTNLYKMNQNGFELINRQECCRQNFTIGHVQINRQGNIFITIHSWIIRVYQVKNGITNLVQTIIPQFTNAVLSFSGKYLVTYPYGLGAYLYYLNEEGIFQQSSILSINAPIAMSPEGEYIIQLKQPSKQLILNQNNGKSIEKITLFDLPNYPKQTTYSQKKLYISQKLEGNSYMIALIVDGTRMPKSYIHLYQLKDMVLTYKQTITLQYENIAVHITRNANYIAVAPKLSAKLAFIYQYQPQTKQYQFMKKFWEINSFPNDIYISENGNFLAVGLIPQSEFQALNDKDQNIAFFFKCKGSCQNCSWANTCNSCKSGKIMRDNQCTCRPNYSLSGEVCTFCGVQNCQHCDKQSICSICKEGYYAKNGHCIRQKLWFQKVFGDGKQIKHEDDQKEVVDSLQFRLMEYFLTICLYSFCILGLVKLISIAVKKIYLWRKQPPIKSLIEETPMKVIQKQNVSISSKQISQINS